MRRIRPRPLAHLILPTDCGDMPDQSPLAAELARMEPAFCASAQQKRVVPAFEPCAAPEVV